MKKLLLGILLLPLIASCDSGYETREDLYYRISELEEQVEELENKLDNIESIAVDGINEASWAEWGNYYDMGDALETCEEYFRQIEDEAYY